jgi:hypothetical protein
VIVTVPLSALLSRALVAFTIEFDNEFEHRMPHRTTRGPAAHSGRGQWLVSMAMWSNFMRYLDADRTPLREVEDLVALTNLGGMQRWGYVAVDGDAVCPTRAGRQAQEIWRPLAAEIEGRWRARYGDQVVAEARQALAGLDDPALPRYLPVAAVSRLDRTAHRLAKGHRDDDVDLSVLLSRAMMTSMREFERESGLPLPLSANILRVLSEPGVRARDLTRRSALEAFDRLEDALTPYPDGWRAHPPYRSQTEAFVENAALPHARSCHTAAATPTAASPDRPHRDGGFSRSAGWRPAP